MKENDELTSGELKEKLPKECGDEVSATTIRCVKCNVLGWKSKNARYCQFVHEPNKMKRLVFSLNAIVNKDTLEDVIFTDKTSVQIEQYARICFKDMFQKRWQSTQTERTPKTSSEGKCPQADYFFNLNIILTFAL